MAYTYTGDAAAQLAASYRADADPYPTSDAMDFPRYAQERQVPRILQELFFPRCWNATPLVRDERTVAERLEDIGALLGAGIRPYGNETPDDTVTSVIDRLPAIRSLLKKDAEAAYKGDPAAKSYLEVIRSYPGFFATVVHRVAHELYAAGEPEYARELTEYARTKTGIDVHPGAEIGEYFFVDHGTGVVVGETATVGDRVRIYQDVTLGALHFEEAEGEEHALAKGYKRHPDIGNHVVIGAGTKVLGAVTVGDHVSIGANSWVTEDVPANTKVFVSDHPTQERKQVD
ncbi:serine acetyltransferase [Halobacteriales archaeon SW_12_69_24]|jgi:serine O-acetyltransferase|nr:MAG: serine acetyltransferase [Halobacteriales archaeon SW_12_69_24]